MSNLRTHAEQELNIVGEHGFMRDHILTMVDIFAEEGHSGGSAFYAVALLAKLLKYEPLSHLTGENTEWVEVGEDLWQNNRCSHVFKNAERAYDIDGRVFRDPDGYCFTNGESHTTVTFPYTPTREYVDVPIGDES